jgi:hypothetical protein
MVCEWSSLSLGVARDARVDARSRCFVRLEDLGCSKGKAKAPMMNTADDQCYLSTDSKLQEGLLGPPKKFTTLRPCFGMRCGNSAWPKERKPSSNDGTEHTFVAIDVGEEMF